jgi:hypothetical protein
MTNVSGQLIGPTFKRQEIQGDLDFSTPEDGTNCLS